MTHPDAVAVPAVEDPPDRPAVVVAISARSLVPHPASVRTARPRHAAATPAEKALPGPAVNASPPKTSAPRRADAGSVPQHVGGTQSRRVKIPSQTAQRESARADHRPSESIWPWLGLALLLAGLTSISLAAVSVGARGAAAIPLLAARLRTTRPSVTGIATRMRSKGLSAGANGRVADRPRERRGIRYRD